MRDDLNQNTGVMELLNMEFYAYHGCFSEEKIIGNKFVVSLSAHTDINKAAMSDKLEDAVNYQEVYNVIRQEMEITSNLLENVAYRIITECHKRFPQIIEARVEVSKLNPPIGGKVGESKVIIDRTFNEN